MTPGRYTFGKRQKEEPKMKLPLRLAAALLVPALLFGCTAGLGTEPTVTREPIPATAENAFPAALTSAAAGDVPYTWMEEGETSQPLLEPVAPQMDKQTAANNAAAVFAAAGLEQEGSIRLGLVSVKDGGESRILSNSLETLWPDADAVYLATYEDSGDDGTGYPAAIFDAITGKVYFLFLDGDPMRAYSNYFDSLPAEPVQGDSAGKAAVGEAAETGNTLPDPRYAQVARAANDWVEQVSADPMALLNQLMPLLGWQVAGVEGCTAQEPWPESYSDFSQQAVANSQLWPYLLNLSFTTADGSRWTGTWDPVLQKPVLLCCLGSQVQLPDNCRGDWGGRVTFCLVPGRPVNDPDHLAANYALQDSSGLWRSVTYMDGVGAESLGTDDSFSVEKHAEDLYWYDPASEEGWRPLSEGEWATDTSGQTPQQATDGKGR